MSVLTRVCKRILTPASLHEAWECDGEFPWPRGCSQCECMLKGQRRVSWFSWQRRVTTWLTRQRAVVRPNRLKLSSVSLPCFKIQKTYSRRLPQNLFIRCIKPLPGIYGTKRPASPRGVWMTHTGEDSIKQSWLNMVSLALAATDAYSQQNLTLSQTKPTRTHLKFTASLGFLFFLICFVLFVRRIYLSVLAVNSISIHLLAFWTYPFWWF